MWQLGKKLKQVSKQVLGSFWPYFGIRVTNWKVEMNNPYPISKKGQKVSQIVCYLLVDNPKVGWKVQKNVLFGWNRSDFDLPDSMAQKLIGNSFWLFTVIASPMNHNAMLKWWGTGLPVEDDLLKVLVIWSELTLSSCFTTHVFRRLKAKWRDYSSKNPFLIS